MSPSSGTITSIRAWGIERSQVGFSENRLPVPYQSWFFIICWNENSRIHQRDEPNQSNHHFWWWRILHIYFIFGVDPHFDGLNANFSDPDHILAYSPSFSETQLHFFFLRLQLSVDVDWSSSTANFCASEHGLSVLLGNLMIDQCISGTILSNKPKWQSSQLWVGI